MQSIRAWLTPLRFLISGGLLAYLIWRANPASIWAAWGDVSVPLLSLAFVAQFIGLTINCWKWSNLLHAAGYPLPYFWLLRVYLVGQFASNFLPTAVGGDAVRIVIAGRRLDSYTQASATVFLERIAGFIALSLVANVALLLAATNVLGARLVTRLDLTLAAALFGLAGVVVGLTALASPQLLNMFGKWLPEQVRRPLESVTEALGGFANRPAVIVQAILISFLYHTAWIGSHVLCGLALGLSAPPLIYALMVPITDIVGLVPIFVNNLGARELVFSLYLAQVGINEASALALAFLAFTVRLVLSSSGGLVALVGGTEMRLKALKR
jgi:hypothetical protein